jgi:hypothetical protein
MRVWVAALAALQAPAQTTQGLISGRVVDSVTGKPIPAASIGVSSEATNTRAAFATDPAGYFAAPSLPPGNYRLRVSAAGYQAQEAFNLELAVAGRLDVDFRLRPAGDVWESGEQRSVFLPGSRSLVTFFGPDVDTSRTSYVQATRGRGGALEATVSSVIDPLEVRDLPLAGRDVYTMLVTQANVTADSSTLRGLGLAVNGQRPSASNFYLDGVQNNNFLVSGPLTVIAPEAVQEYRVSTSNFSAEYGGASGFVANAVTRAGGNQWRGLGYYYAKNDALNANSFQRNLAARGRARNRESQPGFQAGGPLVRGRLFVSSALERLASRGEADPQTYRFPSRIALDFLIPGTESRKLIQRYPVPYLVNSPGLVSSVVLTPPNSANRTVALQRGDWIRRGGARRINGRLSLARVDRPDFVWSPYPDFRAPLSQRDWGAMAASQDSLRPSLVNEARVSIGSGALAWDRPHPELPTLTTGDLVTLPGAPNLYAYRNRSRSVEVQDNLTWLRGRHILKFGGSGLLRSVSGHLTYGRDGQYLFGDILDFALDGPAVYRAGVERLTTTDTTPNFEREYRVRQFALFAADTLRLGRRLTVNLGLRYESLGAPVNSGPAKDLVPLPGAQVFNVRLPAPGSGDQRLYAPDRNDWAGRFGLSLALDRATILRMAYGIFHDRPYDNAWQRLRSNQTQFVVATVNDVPAEYRNPVLRRPARPAFPSLVMIQPDLRTPYAHSYFAQAERRIGESLAVAVAGSGSLGRKLLTNDWLDRQAVVIRPSASMNYLANQGLSAHHSLSATARLAVGGHRLHAAYTWGHTIDNQSEILGDELGDLNSELAGSRSAARGYPVYNAFQRAGDSRGDRGNSDFDQRHNLLLHSLWELPGPLRGWRVSQLAAFRTGFPYSVLWPIQAVVDFPLNDRSALVAGVATAASAEVAGGRLLLNRAAFARARRGEGHGRNAFRGPGLYSMDLSAARSFRLSRLGESRQLTFRADAFNLLNHTNLGQPVALVDSPRFGVATYGRVSQGGGGPGSSPLSEAGRQVQLLVRLEF